MAKVRVKINRAEFGRQVTGSSEAMAAVAHHAQRVQRQVPGSEVEVVRQAVRGGGQRATARISKGTNAEEARSGALLTALMNVARAKRTRR